MIPPRHSQIFFRCKHICDTKWDVSIELGNLKVKANDSDQIWPFDYSKHTDTLYKSYGTKSLSLMEYKYDSLHGDLPDVYTFEKLHKVSKLLSDGVPCGVKDLEHGWCVLDGQPIQSSSKPSDYHYSLLQF